MVRIQFDSILEQEILLRALSEYALLEHNFGNHHRAKEVEKLKEKVVSQMQ